MREQTKRTKAKQHSSEGIWAQHLAWLEVTGQEARANRDRQQREQQKPPAQA